MENCCETYRYFIALIMTSTLAHAGVMPEDLMLPAVEATTEVAEQVVVGSQHLKNS